jgi:dimethylhistidine N-methyltransferase
MSTTEALPMIDQSPETDSFREAVLSGLQRPQKEVPSKFLYDARGSKLFDAICELDEYYPTRTEMAIMEDNVDAMVDAIGERALLAEYGSGSSLKTRILLDHARDLAAYVPIDISREHLAEAAEEIAEAYPGLPVQPLCADYTEELTLPAPPQPAQRTVVYYPGSTIGNFHPDRALPFLRRVAETAGAGGGLLIGVDLRKDVDVIRAAYNDADGVTAAFNKNLLRRINRELGGTFDLDRFEHEGRWKGEKGCIEMHLVSTEAQRVRIDGQTVDFEAGETIRTEYSFKYTLEGFEALAAEAGFAVEQVWTDADDYFSIQYCTVDVE